MRVVRLDGQIGEIKRVQVRLNPGADRAKGVDALSARPLAVGKLQVAGGDVVDDGDPADDRLPVRSLDILAWHADNEREFSLELDAGSKLRNLDWGAGAHDSGGGLDEDGRREMLSRFLEYFRDVVGVVAADRHDL